MEGNDRDDKVWQEPLYNPMEEDEWDVEHASPQKKQ